MTDEEYENHIVNAELTVHDIRAILHCVNSQENVYLDADLGGSDDSGIDGMTVAEFYAWVESIMSKLGTP